MAGHSKWAQIKYRKAIADAKKAKIFSKISAQISAAARRGSDPATNASLREAIDRAREVSMPQENIERAIKRGAGLMPGTAIEEFLLEAYGPGGVGLLISALTDNRNRLLNEVKEILKKNDGKLAKAGSVRWLFQEVGHFTILPEKRSDDLELWLIDRGVNEIKKDDDYLSVYTKKEDFENLRRDLLRLGIPFESRLEFLPLSTVAVRDQETKEKLERVFEALDDNEGIQEIYSNATFD